MICISFFITLIMLAERKQIIFILIFLRQKYNNIFSFFPFLSLISPVYVPLLSLKFLTSFYFIVEIYKRQMMDRQTKQVLVEETDIEMKIFTQDCGVKNESLRLKTRFVQTQSLCSTAESSFLVCKPHQLPMAGEFINLRGATTIIFQPLMESQYLFLYPQSSFQNSSKELLCPVAEIITEIPNRSKCREQMTMCRKWKLLVCPGHPARLAPK